MPMADDASQELLLIVWSKTVDKFQFNYIVSHKLMQTQTHTERKIKRESERETRTQMKWVNRNVSFCVVCFFLFLFFFATTLGENIERF